MSDLRSKVIRLAHQNPSLRPHLLPLLGIRVADDKSFEEAIEGKKFTNPETGNKVQFGSLPYEEQARIREKWTDRRDYRKEKKAPRKENKELKRKVLDLENELKSAEGSYSAGSVFNAASSYLNSSAAEDKYSTIRGFPRDIPIWEDDAPKEVNEYFKKLDKEIEDFEDLNRTEGPEQDADYSDDIRSLKNSVEKYKKKVKDGLGDFVKAKKDWRDHSDKNDIYDDDFDQYFDDDSDDEKGGKKASLRSRAIRLAYQNPPIRLYLLPLLTGSRWTNRQR